MTRSGTLVIRVDGGPGIGNGHVMRAVALTEAWRHAGGDVRLATASLPSALSAAVTEAGAEVVPVTEGPDAVRELVDRQPPSWVLFDGYGFGREFQRAARSGGARVAVVDDHALVGSYDADLIVDQNVGASERAYRSAGAARLLLGPRYVLLRRAFLEVEPRDAPADVAAMVVTLGGAPPPWATTLVERAIELAALPAETVMLTGGRRTDDMASLLARCDLAVSASGTTVWELCRLGVPAVVIPIVENQRPVAAELQRAGAALVVEPPSGAEHLAAVIVGLAKDRTARRELGRRGRELVDGLGARRAVTAMRAQQLGLRPAGRADARLLYDWANDPQTRTASFDPAVIEWDHHVRWVEGQLASPDARILIVSDDEGPVGQLRCRREGDEGTVGVVVAPDRRGQHLAGPLISAASRHLLDAGFCRRLHAWIKPENLASQRAFADADYRRLPDGRFGAHHAVHYALGHDEHG